MTGMDASATGALLGAVVGFILALSGAGGGILAVPLLVFGLHLTISQAAPVGLIAVGLAALVGAVIGLREGIVRYRAAGLIGITGMVLAPFGVWLAQRVPNMPLMLAFAALLAYVALRMWRQARGLATADAHIATASLPCIVNPTEGRLTWTLPCARALAGTGLFSGTLTGLLGVGGGFVIVPALARYTDLGIRSIQATSLAVIALVSVGGIGAAAAHGAIDWGVAAPFAGGAVVALLGGRMIAKRISGARLQQAFALVSAAVAVLMVARAFGALH